MSILLFSGCPKGEVLTNRRLQTMKRSHLTTLALTSIATALVGAACSADQPQEEIVDDRPVVPEPLTTGETRQFVMPEAILAPYEERMFCHVVDWVPEQDYLITRFEKFQGRMGHHMQAFTSTIPRELGSTFECETGEMSTMFPLTIVDIPEGFAVRLRQGAQVVLQSHYINHGDKPIRVADVARYGFPGPGETPTETDYLILISYDDVPMGVTSISLGCQVNFENPVNILQVFGHMHELGTRFTFSVGRNGTMQDVYKVDPWEAIHRDFPPVASFLNEPVVVNPGDEIRMDCEYNNTRDHVAKWGEEMCSTVSYYYPVQPKSGVMPCAE